MDQFYVILLLICVAFIPCELRYLSGSNYCCFRDGVKHVLCRNPGARPPPDCEGYHERMSGGGGTMSYLLYLINGLRDDVSRGNITGWPKASAMNRLEMTEELNYIARSMASMCLKGEEFKKQGISSVNYPTIYTFFVRKEYNKSEYHPSEIDVIEEEIGLFRNKSGEHSPKDLENFDPSNSKFPIMGTLYDFLRWIACSSNTRDIPETDEEREKRIKEQRGWKDYYQILCVMGPVEGLRKGSGKSYKLGRPRSACYWERTAVDPYYPHLCASRAHFTSLTKPSLIFFITQIMLTSF